MQTSLHVRDWEEMAKVDSLWAILSEPDKQFGSWDMDAFLQTGQVEIKALMESTHQAGLPKFYRRAMDFGCGIGRLTRALHGYFSECHGVDISSAMLATARQLTPECNFQQAADLTAFPDGSADLINSSMVLQHQPDRKHVALLIADMVRVLAPGWLLVFQNALVLALAEPPSIAPPAVSLLPRSWPGSHF